MSGGTIYNAVVIMDETGNIINRHRKLMPTNPERMVWGFGDGKGLQVVNTPVGKAGALLCWENYMPLALTRRDDGTYEDGGGRVFRVPEISGDAPNAPGET